MSDYKDTLNLAGTSFPMKASLAQREPRQLEQWKRMDIYAMIRAARKGAKRFILHDGPPYANGEIHIGHAVNKILKDFIVKSKTLSGYDAPYVPGWDCHGLPIEHRIEQKHGKPGKKITPAEFRSRCRKYAARQLENQRESFQRLGVFGAWQERYASMDFASEAGIVRALGKLIANGHLRRGAKPVLWCVDCESALAEAEVEYEDRISPAVDVAFPVADPAEFERRLTSNGSADWPASARGKPIAVPIWTTTPWTLLANRAVALRADERYELFALRGDQQGETQGRLLLIAAKLAPEALRRYGQEASPPLASCLGSALEGVVLRHPLFDFQVPLTLSDHVTAESGTGAVHIAPGHGLEDFAVGQRYGLETACPVDERGRFSSEPWVPEQLAGQQVSRCAEAIAERLREAGNLLASQPFEHSYPHCWRHKSPVIFRATAQWFVDMQSGALLERAQRAVEEIAWIPGWGKARISAMLEGRPDWCVSRQRCWGTPMPLFVKRDDHALHPRTPELLEQVAARIEREGIEAWFALDARELLGDEADQYRKLTDTLDVWFDSGVTHQFVLRGHPAYAGDPHCPPADLYLEGSDQHRGWFQSALLSSLAIDGSPPYRAALTHGFAVDGEGRKMSKSLGNQMDPAQITRTLGADVLRLWVAATDYQREMQVSQEIFTRISEAYRRIRNTARFVLANLTGFDPQSDLVEPRDLLSLDRWIVGEAMRLQNEIRSACEEYAFHRVYQALHNFCVRELGAFYLDIIKDRQYTCARDSLPRRSAQSALFHIGEALARWIAPILSFTAEEMWAHLPGPREPTVFTSHWLDDPLAGQTAAGAPIDWEALIRCKGEVNRLIEAQRKAGQIGPSLQAEVTLYCDADWRSRFTPLGDELRFVLITSSASARPLAERPQDAQDTAEPGLAARIVPSAHPKCARCWHHVASVGDSEQHPALCSRCIANIEANQANHANGGAAKGETRRHA